MFPLSTKSLCALKKVCALFLFTRKELSKSRTNQQPGCFLSFGQGAVPLWCHRTKHVTKILRSSHLLCSGPSNVHNLRENLSKDVTTFYPHTYVNSLIEWSVVIVLQAHSGAFGDHLFMFSNTPAWNTKASFPCDAHTISSSVLPFYCHPCF